ncbi:MAG: o-succinylbenzoate synthase [Ignavibacteriae bacterium]|nr:o-succinylbenzoate synthase [Ignavibacteriota bacterium]
MELLLQRIILREIRLPLKEPFQISSGTVHERRILLLELQSADGVRGWSECVAGEYPNYSPETIDTAWYAIKEWIAPRVLGTSFSEPRDIYAALSDNIRGHNMAKAAVEMGAWELAARSRDMSLAKLLGGMREKVEVGISLGIQPTVKALVDKVERSFQQGYRKVKIKIKPGKDIEYVRAARESAGKHASLMVDANNAYSLKDLPVLKQLDGFGLLMIEQPLSWDDVVQHAELQKILKTPICLDESITGVDKAEDMVKFGSGKIINIKPGRVGGFRSSIAIHDYCASHGIPVWCGGMLESGVGRAHNVALASLSNFSLPGDLSPSSRYWEEDIVIPEWTMDSNGFVTVPVNTLGMGVEVNMNRVEKLTVRSETLTSHK